MAAAVKLSPSAVMPTTSNMGMSYALVLYVQSSNRTSQYWCSSLMVALVLMKKCVRAWSEPSLYWQYAFSSGRFSSANMAWADVRSSMNSRRCRLTALLTSCSVMRLSGRSCFRARRMPPGVRPLERSDATWSYTSGKSRRSDGCAVMCTLRPWLCTALAPVLTAVHCPSRPRRQRILTAQPHMRDEVWRWRVASVRSRRSSYGRPRSQTNSRYRGDDERTTMAKPLSAAKARSAAFRSPNVAYCVDASSAANCSGASFVPASSLPSLPSLLSPSSSVPVGSRIPSLQGGCAWPGPAAAAPSAMPVVISRPDGAAGASCTSATATAVALGPPALPAPVVESGAPSATAVDVLMAAGQAQTTSAGPLHGQCRAQHAAARAAPPRVRPGHHGRE